MIASRPKEKGQVFTMSGAKVTRSEDLIQATCFVNEVPLIVLYDSGSTHSFISINCVKQFGLSIDSLPFDLIVSTPTDAPVVAFMLRMNCPIVIKGRKFLIDLIFLPLSNLDVILGMDWLSGNHVLLNIFDKTIVFQTRDCFVLDQDGLKFMTANQVTTSLNEGALAYILLSSLKVEVYQKIIQVPVVSEFPEVFPDDIPELPPLREVEFTIDLVPGAEPISIAPHRMAPKELEELKS
ncbi:PREDICTED: uncharacterized protein LOC109329360 [Lupinus angustifolius]|uniref:uncharacterized protein LOC109329360 n=1 Tax=Lupinus angustifolius TaxID=3871 RepID=UPI00092F5A51|nr:PREDICTED: uncharacterized protein LOC109329360 [Lupinus angustifolius]